MQLCCAWLLHVSLNDLLITRMTVFKYWPKDRLCQLSFFVFYNIRTLWSVVKSLAVFNAAVTMKAKIFPCNDLGSGFECFFIPCPAFLSFFRQFSSPTNNGKYKLSVCILLF